MKLKAYMRVRRYQSLKTAGEIVDYKFRGIPVRVLPFARFPEGIDILIMKDIGNQVCLPGATMEADWRLKYGGLSADA